MTSCDGICTFPPFNPNVIPESSDVDILRTEIEDYLSEMKAQICADLRCLNAATVGYVPPIQVNSVILDIPSIVANGSFTTDITVTGVPLGTHVISWAPLTLATSLDDLLVQFLVVDEDTVRITIDNPSPGAVDPDPITFQFITATAEDTQ